jgi:protein TonB
MSNYTKALLLTSFIFTLIFLLLERFELPKPISEEYTPINLSLYDPKPIVKKVIQKKAPQTKKRKKVKPIKSNIVQKKTVSKVAKRVDEKESNQTVNISKASVKIPSLNELNALFMPQKPKIDQKILDLYGDRIYALSQEELKFIDENLNVISAITQSYLEYPLAAQTLRIKGVTILEFYLYPNGDISDMKVIKSSGYEILDSNSIRTIEIAYKDYPHPKTKTHIRFFIEYKL